MPTLLFVNKIDRGADDERVLAGIRAKLSAAIVPLGSSRRPGRRPAADAVALLADHDDALLAAYVDDAGVPAARLRAELAEQTRAALVHPVFFGSAATGAGVDVLMAGIAELLPAAAGDPGGPVAGTVFKVERGPAGEKVAFVRMRSGTLDARPAGAARRA
jgi:ribosomal protection tetracycline resistance protein